MVKRLILKIINRVPVLESYEVKERKEEGIAYETAAMYKGYIEEEGSKINVRIYKNRMDSVIRSIEPLTLIPLNNLVVSRIDTLKENEDNAKLKIKKDFEAIIEEALNLATDFMDDSQSILTEVMKKYDK